uniref:PH domain-containing protein n=1 Tax=Hucho hucho TaxID=62062 RepID=A0A4W5KD67_9TELE
MASKRNPNILYVQEPRESLSSLETDHLAQPEPGEESSDSDGEPDETEQKLTRKVSTSGQLRAKKSVKEGILLKQTSSFQRWKRRFFKLRGRTLYYAKDSKSLIFDEVDLSDASVAETSTKNINNSFTVTMKTHYFSYRNQDHSCAANMILSPSLYYLLIYTLSLSIKFQFK